MAVVRTNRFRRWAAMWSSPVFCVYDWSVWSGSLIRNIAPRAKRIEARLEETPQDLAGRLPPGSRTLVLHLDISNNAPFISDPGEFARVMQERGIRVLNQAVRDIQKRTVQTCCEEFGLGSLLAPQSGDPHELLIVKTNLNAGGGREQKIPAELRQKLNLPMHYSPINGAQGYYIKPRAELEQQLWNDPDLVVERFIQNPHGRFFRVYVAIDAVVISGAYMDAPLKHMGGDIRRHNHWGWKHGQEIEIQKPCASKLPESLLRVAGIFLERFGLDYGAIDIVESAQEEYFIVDANKTPFWGKEHQPGLLGHLRSGFLKAKAGR